jgi:hypothetical protein
MKIHVLTVYIYFLSISVIFCPYILQMREKNDRIRKIRKMKGWEGNEREPPPPPLPVALASEASRGGVLNSF